ncbi:MAG TPA: asparagine synthase (glutamine-hydrolyzing) [Candidatus Binataceae bacterium]|nr:asparagine synthase (glutamine-hydrolyzing) [Candidatus Binataceae bacterium]
MCGIGGLLGIRDEDGAVAQRILAALRHRGPDDEGFVQLLPAASLVHTRLSIFDLTSAGHQPMSDRSARDNDALWVVFNGEIYNFRELQTELVGAGYSFNTRCDTEVILKSYRHWGADAVKHWRGMFAICLVDLARRTAWLYRDRLGIKPLYTYRPAGGGLIFASEARALLAAGPELVERRVDPAAMETFLAQGAVQGYAGFIKGISLLRPGEMVGVDLDTGNEIGRSTYWSFPQQTPAIRSRDRTISELREVAADALRLHLASDAPLGLFLSGGIDSAALLAMASHSFTGQLRTLTVGFDAARFDESAAAALTAARFPVEHQTIHLGGEDVLAHLDDALAAVDQPTVDGFNTYFVSRAARDAGLTVALSGLGGDELFGGYATFRDVPRAQALRNNPVARTAALIAGHFAGGRAGPKLLEACQRPSDTLSMYLLRREVFLPIDRRALMPLPRECDAQSGLNSDLMHEVREQSRSTDAATQISFLEMNLYMRHMLLRDADAFSMATPIEYRVPFLDHRLVEAVFPLSGALKLPDPRPKPLLLDIAEGAVPRSVWQRAKQGFAFPWANWFAAGNPLHERARDAVNDLHTWRDLGLEARAIETIWRRFQTNDRRTSPLQILSFVVLRDFCARHQLSAA